LIDSVPLCAELINAMLADRGAASRVTAAQTRPHVTAGGPAMVSALLGEHCGDPALAIAEFRERYAATPTPPDCLYPGVRQGLAALRARGVGLGVVSNKPQALCEKVIGELHLAPLFGAIVGTGPGVPLKPDPTGLDLALARLGATRDDCCYVGDSEPDHALARRAGVPLVMVTYGYAEPGRPWPEAAAADDFSAVPGLVAALLAARMTA
jgi:phosphoglycolate phosphatase